MANIIVVQAQRDELGNVVLGAQRNIAMQTIVAQQQRDESGNIVLGSQRPDRKGDTGPPRDSNEQGP